MSSVPSTLHGRPFVPRGMKTFDPDTISWSVGGKPCVLEWDSFEASTPGGFGILNAKVMPNRTGHRKRIWQGDKVVGHKPDGDVAYEGKLQAPPKFVDDVAYIQAVGPQDVVNRYNERLPYQIRDQSQWHELHAEPAKFSGNSAKFDIAQKGNSVGIKVGSGQTYAANDNMGYYLWVQGWDIAKVRFTLRRSASDANFDLRVRGSDDTFGTPTTLNSFVMSTADATEEAVNIGDYSVVVIDWNANGASSPASRRFWAEDLRVGVITDQDTFSSGEVVSDVAARCNYDVASEGGTNVLPLDWNAPASDLLDYMALIEDNAWYVMHSNKKGYYGKLFFQPWGRRTWHTRIGDWAEDQGLQMLPLYDSFTTTFDNPPGVQQQVRSSTGDVGLKDPLPSSRYDYPEPLHLEDPQADKGLAEAVNAKALSRLTKLRVSGSVTVRYVSKGVPYDMWPGDLLDLGDFQPRIPAQRISRVTYNRDGSVSCQLEDLSDVASLVDRLILRRIKRRNRKRG